MSPVTKRFVVWADARTIGVFVPRLTSPATVTEILTVAAAKIPGSRVLPGELDALVTARAESSSYDFGTRGGLSFEEDQSRSSLEQSLRTVAEAVVARGYGVFEPLEIEPSVK